MASLLSASSAPSDILALERPLLHSHGSGYFVQIGCKKILRRDPALRHSPCSARLDELDVGYTHEPEDETQIRNFVVQRAQSRFFVASSARDDRHYLFVRAG